MKLRSLCLVCGRMEKTPGTGSYFQIRESKIFSTDGAPALAKKLTDILGYNFEQPSISKFIASDKICKKCFRTVSELVKMEDQVKKCKENLVSSFLRTTSKINKNENSCCLPNINQQNRKGVRTLTTQNRQFHNKLHLYPSQVRCSMSQE